MIMWSLGDSLTDRKLEKSPVQSGDGCITHGYVGEDDLGNKKHGLLKSSSLKLAFSDEGGVVQE